MKIKSFGKNTLFYAIGIIAIRFTTFLLIPLYTHYLSKEEYGLLATLLFTTEIIITINDVGMRSAIMRFFSEFHVNNKLNELIGSSIFLNVFVVIILIVISYFIPEAYLSNMFHINILENIIILTILVGVTRTLSLNILSYFRAKGLGNAYMYVSIASSLVLVISTWLALRTFSMGINGVLYAQIFSFGLMWLIVLLWIYKKDGMKISLPTSKLLLKFGYPLIMATSGTILVNTSGNYFLGYFRNLEEVAILAIAYKVATIGIMVLIAPFQLAYEPYVFANKNNPNIKNIISKIITYITFSYLLISLLILFLFKYLIQLIGNGGYNSAYNLVFLLIPALGFTAINYIGQSLIHLNNKTKTTGFISFIVTVVSIILAYFATKFYGLYGTIFGVNFYVVISGLILMYYGNKEFSIPFEYKRITTILFLAVFLFIAFYLLSFYSVLVFYLLTTILIALSLIGLFYFNFFDSGEKIFIKKGYSHFLGFLKIG